MDPVNAQLSIPPDPDRVVLAGDWHGNINRAVGVITSAGMRDITTVVHLGDFGFWTPGAWTDRFLAAVETACTAYGVTLLWVDGNHECVDMSTRMVTRRGFVSIDNLRCDDEVMSVNDDLETIWERPTAVVRKKFQGVLHGIESRRISMRVTPQHRVVGLDRERRWVEYSGDEFSSRTLYLVQSGINPGDDHPDVSDDDLRLMAWCLTDSTRKPITNSWVFSQRESGSRRILDLLDRLHIPYTTSTRHRAPAEICGRRVLSTEPEVTVRVPAAESRDIPWAHDALDPVVWKLSQRQVSVFLEELVFCDGSKHPAGTTAGVLYCSLDDLWVDELQVLLIANGYRIKQTTVRGNDRRLNICRASTVQVTARHRAAATAFTEDIYDGEVWCITVPSGRFFAERNGTVFLTGNCFPSLYELSIDEDTGLRPISEHVAHLPRGLRWTWHGRTWMALGGAHSPDRQMRKEGKSWWPQEHLSDADIEAAIAPGAVDVIVAHDAPDKVDIPGLSPTAFPVREIAASEEHRRQVGQVVDATTPELFFHGHYHRRYNARRGRTLVVGLADDGGPPVDNMALLNLAGGLDAPEPLFART